MALNDLAAAAEDADAGGSLYPLASGLVEPALARVAPEEGMRLVSAMRPRTWLRLDAELRGLRHWFRPGDQWQQLTDAAWAGSNPLALLLVACSGDGRMRQRAVLTPLMRSDQRLLPLLVIRSADWVEQVRVDARRELFEALYAADGDGLIRAAGVAMEMRDWSRGDFAVAAVSEALRTGSHRALDAARASDDIQVRRLAYRLWLESGHANSDAVIRAALTEGDVVCQRLCAKTAVSVAVRDRQRDTLDRLLSARFARVRVEALAGLVQIGQPEAAEDVLADRSAMMRGTAQWAMRRAGRDAAEQYRAMLASGDDSRLRSVVAGLSECGTVDDAESLAGFLRHARPRMRAEAVRAVRRLGGNLSQIAEMLTDPAPAVVRPVVAALRNRPDLVSAERLWELLGADQPQHIRRAAFKLLIARDTWTRIAADLGLVADTDDKLRAYARSDLNGWLDLDAATTYEMPPQSAHDRLRRLIDAAEPDIGTANARLLRWHLSVSR
ncbi:MAG: hypothetical protein QOF31_3093 [Mycobacterium sp.]|jgi:hypothetical protein|nr:hypothetical protein [Mycobacterium sp.]